jgi:hypothetical protein
MDLQKYTDDVIALAVVLGTFGSYYVQGVDVPNEPMMFVLGYFFGRKLAAANARSE